MNEERERRYPRIESENIISIKHAAAPDEDNVFTTSKVIGLGGVMFESREKTAVGENLEMSLLAGTDLLQVKVRVVWVNESGKERWMVGVEFVDISDEDRTKLLDYLMRRVYLEEEEDLE